MSGPRSRDLILLLVAASSIMELLWLGHKELAHDEPFTVLQAHRTLSGLFAILPEENNPPLHFILVHFWLKLIPLEVGWLRVPSVLFSALTIWPLFLLGRSLGNLRVAIVASLLFMFSSYHFGFAHEVRAYSLFALLATTSVWQLYRMVQGRSVIWLVLVNMLMVYTHFFGWLMIGIQFLMVLLLKEWRPYLTGYLRAILLVITAYLPYAFIFFKRLGTSVGQGTWLTSPSLEEIYNMLWRWSNVPVAVVFLLAIMIIHLYRTKGEMLLTRIGMIWAFIPLVAMFAASFFAPMFLDRYLIYASPGYYLLSAIALDTAFIHERTRFIPSAIAIALMAFTFSPFDNSWPVPSKVVDASHQLRTSEDIPIYIHPWWYAHTYAWHSDKFLFKDPDRLIEELQQHGVGTVTDLIDLIERSQEHGEIIVIVAGAEEQRRFKALQEEHELPVVESIQPNEHVHVHRIRK